MALTLKKWQRDNRLSDREAAARLGMSRTTLHHYKHGRPMPLYVRLAVAALAAGIKPAAE